MIEHKLKQRSKEWFDARSHLPTASNFNKIITGSGAISSQFNDYALEVGGISKKNDFTSFHIERGINFENEALKKYEIDNFVKINEVGFITDDKNMAGCSPDGVFTDFNEIYCGIEVKCPTEKNHLKYKKDDKCPARYYSQVMGSIAICGVESWIFASYDVKSKELWSKKILRDDDWIRKFWDLIKVFNLSVIMVRKKHEK